MANQKSLFETSAEKAIRRANALQNRAEQMLTAFRNHQAQEAYDMALETERDAEKLALLCRDMVVSTGHPSAEKDMEMVMAEEIPVAMGFTEQGWFVLKLPELLPRKEKGKGSVSYIRGYLYSALNRFFRESAVCCFDSCVIIYRHVYDREYPEKQYRDHDNIEVNFVTDALAMYVMADDAALRCQHHYCSAIGDQSKTEVYVIPEHDFLRWYQLSQTHSEEGGITLDSLSLFERKDNQKQGKNAVPEKGSSEEAEKPLRRQLFSEARQSVFREGEQA